VKTALAGQIARALAVFCVDEVIIFDDGSDALRNKHQDPELTTADRESGYTAFNDPNHFLFHILSYLETPPQFRRLLFPYHPNLRTAGALNSLDMPHHLRVNEWCQYREGVTIAESAASVGSKKSRDAKFCTDHTVQPSKKRKTSKDSMAKDRAAQSTLVDAGFPDPVTIPTQIPPSTRVTLKFPFALPPTTFHDLHADAVSPDAPREEAGYYWGFVPRAASSPSTIFTECPYEGGYDFSIGTSERGRPLKELLHTAITPKWQHLLITFGGLGGLETAVANDQKLIDKGIKFPSELFDAWINLVEGQGSRTIRTEEAVWIGLMGLKDFIAANGNNEPDNT